MSRCDSPGPTVSSRVGSNRPWAEARSAPPPIAVGHDDRPSVSQVAVRALDPDGLRSSSGPSTAARMSPLRRGAREGGCRRAAVCSHSPSDGYPGATPSGRTRHEAAEGLSRLTGVYFRCCDSSPPILVGVSVAAMRGSQVHESSGGPRITLCASSVRTPRRAPLESSRRWPSPWSRARPSRSGERVAPVDQVEEHHVP
jgi:hypothetical protein